MATVDKKIFSNGSQYKKIPIKNLGDSKVSTPILNPEKDTHNAYELSLFASAADSFELENQSSHGDSEKSTLAFRDFSRSTSSIRPYQEANPKIISSLKSDSLKSSAALQKVDSNNQIKSAMLFGFGVAFPASGAVATAETFLGTSLASMSVHAALSFFGTSGIAIATVLLASNLVKRDKSN
jgi:hypothetical protein